MNLGNIGLSTALATVPSFGLSAAAGVKRELSAFGGEKILLETKKMSKKAHEEAFGVYSKRGVRFRYCRWKTSKRLSKGFKQEISIRNYTRRPS